MLFFLVGCTTRSPSDDPFLYEVDTGVEYAITLSEPKWVSPSADLPSEIIPMASNNNVDIVFHDGRMFMAWRTAPTHFASEKTIMYIISSDNLGETWEYEHQIVLSTDVREPRFLSFKGTLQFSFFEAGDNPSAFEPKNLWRIFLREDGWSTPEKFLNEESVLWDIKARNGTAYMTTYDGAHYGQGSVYVRFWESNDGMDWTWVENKEFVYQGGVSEMAFEFDLDGALWGVGRNEDGDETGAGTQICYAPAHALSQWSCLENSDPERYDSPEMFRHGRDIYLLGRKDIGGPFGPEGDLLSYSFRPKGFALYKLNVEEPRVEHVMDLPGAGDTSFPSIHRLNAHEFLLSNYTSPLTEPDISWLEGQTSELGTQIYTMKITFSAQ